MDSSTFKRHHTHEHETLNPAVIQSRIEALRALPPLNNREHMRERALEIQRLERELVEAQQKQPRRPRHLPDVIQAMLDVLPTSFIAMRAELTRIKYSCLYTPPECERDRWEEAYEVVMIYLVPAKDRRAVRQALKIWTGEVEI